MKHKVESLVFTLSLLACAGCGEPKQPSQTQDQVTSPGASENEPGIDQVIDVDEFPSIVKQVNPVYPEDAMKNGIEGKVWVKALVDKEGKVKRAVVAKTIDGSASLEKAALDAVRQFTFKPARMKEQPVESWVSIPFLFKLAAKK